MRTKHSEIGCEIIELAIGDIESLTRAFEVIKKACEELSDPEVVIATETVIH